MDSGINCQLDTYHNDCQKLVMLIAGKNHPRRAQKSKSADADNYLAKTPWCLCQIGRLICMIVLPSYHGKEGKDNHND